MLAKKQIAMAVETIATSRPRTHGFSTPLNAFDSAFCSAIAEVSVNSSAVRAVEDELPLIGTPATPTTPAAQSLTPVTMVTERAGHGSPTKS